MYRYDIRQIGEKTWHIEEVNASMYLVAGEESAVLIDTAYGVGDIREVIRSLTDLPVQVVITHAHPDHIGGIGFFEDIYLHYADMGIIATIQDQHIEKTIEILQGSKSYKRHSLKQVPRFHAVRQGTTFDLGGRVLQVIELPGHSFGSIGLLDEKNNMLFSGDACNPNQLLSIPREMRGILAPGTGFSSVYQFKESLEKILRLPVTRLYTGHLNELNYEPAGRWLAESLLECCRAILSGENNGIPCRVLPDEDETCRCVEWRSVRFSYNPREINNDWVIC